MIVHENCLLADNSHEISHLIFFQKLGKMPENVSSAAVVIGALRINSVHNMNVNTCISHLTNSIYIY